MQNLEFNIVQSYEASRKLKEYLLPSSFFEDLNAENRSLSSFPGRVITSGDVARIETSQFSDNEQQEKKPLQDTGNKPTNSPAIKPFTMDARLRTPFRLVKKTKPKLEPRNLSLKKGGMSRPCASLFNRMKEMYPPKKCPSFDPRYSVRRVLKKSGLLKKLGGPDVLEEEELVTSDSDEEEAVVNKEERCCSPCSNESFIKLDEDRFRSPGPPSPMTTEDFLTGLVVTPSRSEFLGVEEDVPSIGQRQKEYQYSSPGSSSFMEEFEKNVMRESQESFNFTQAPDESFNRSFLQTPKSDKTASSPASTLSVSTNKSSNYMFDTVVMKRTVEMQLFQYLPPEDNWEARSVSHHSDQ